MKSVLWVSGASDTIPTGISNESYCLMASYVYLLNKLFITCYVFCGYVGKVKKRHMEDARSSYSPLGMLCKGSLFGIWLANEWFEGRAAGYETYETWSDFI